MDIIAANFLAEARDYINTSEFLENTIGQWLILLGAVLGAMILGKVAMFFLLHSARKMDAIEERFILTSLFAKSLARPLPFVMLGAGLLLGGQGLSMETDIRWLYEKTCLTIIYLAVIWCVFKLVDIVEIFLCHITSKTNTSLDDQLVPLVRKSLRIMVVVMGGLFIATNIFNKNIGALLAGLGIGGLAFALAAKDMLSNLFGSATIFTDRPFGIGDRIRVKDFDGTVEEVGFRSTRLRLLNGHQVVLPNGVVANEAIENISRRPFLKRTLDVTVTYDTTPEKLDRALAILREMLDARGEHFHPDFPSRCYFTDFNSDNLCLQVIYWYTPAEWWDYLAFNNDFNTELLRRFNEEGIEFAFPTQTVYLKQEQDISSQ